MELNSSSNEVSPNVEELTPMQKFYNGTNVFITGGTGFLGKSKFNSNISSFLGVKSFWFAS